MSKRFVVEEKNIVKQNNLISITGEEVHHINVLRYRVKDKIYINNFEVVITELKKDVLKGEVIGNLPLKGIPNINITLIQSYLKSDKMEFVVQKAVELGVKNIIPVITKNTVVKLDEKDRVKKQERLNKIAKEAVEQCGRADEVYVTNILNLNKLDFSIYDSIIVCHETSSNSFKQTLATIKESKNIAVVIGPEGGLDDSEVNSVLNLDNIHVVSLGERILRAETASLNAISVIMYELD